MTNFNPDFDTQGHVGACHIFASLEVIYDATEGIKLSKEKLFLDHLLTLQGTPKRVDEIVDHNLAEIDAVRQSKCPRSVKWEGGKKSIYVGTFENNFEILKTRGGVVVPHNADWNQVENMMRDIKNEQWKAIHDQNYDPEMRKKQLKAVITPAFERSRQSVQENNGRRNVAELMSKFRVEEIELKKEEKYFIEDIYNIIKTIEQKGTAYIQVPAGRFYK